ncbi:MAG: hypothetical protein HQM16_08775 [Deltaproteobacteria bacterium]|nr:hypothetical protein [Deltaproteobacteria bacterium]
MDNFEKTAAIALITLVSLIFAHFKRGTAEEKPFNHNKTTADLIFVPVEVINKIPGPLFLFFLLAVALLSSHLTQNEETVFATALQWADPQFILNSSVFTEPAGARLGINIVAGYALKILTFEQLALCGRIVSYVLYAFSLSKLFKMARLKNLEIAFIFIFYYLGCQSLFAAEWLYGGFESKTIAYPFLFLAIYYYLQERFTAAVVLHALATFFHVLIGFWFALSLGLFLLIKKYPIKTIFKYSGLYLLILSPFLAYLIKVIFLDMSVVDNIDEINYFYTHKRIPHHVCPFTEGFTLSDAFKQGVYGGLFLFGATLSSFFLTKNKKLKDISLLAICIYIQLLTSFFIARFDQYGGFIKYLPFRQGSLAVLFGVLILSYAIKEVVKNSRVLLSLNTVFLVLLILPVWDHIKQMPERLVPDTTVLDIEAYVRDHTPPGSVIYFHGFGLRDAIHEFSRKTRRDKFVSLLVSPSGTAKFEDWYTRLNVKYKIEKDFLLINKARERYRIDYVLSNTKLNYNFLTFIYEANNLKLYKFVESENTSY